VFVLYIYHILVLVIVKHNGDEPPKQKPAAIVIEYAMRMRHIILLFVVCTSLIYFSKLSDKQYDFFKIKFIEH